MLLLRAIYKASSPVQMGRGIPCAGSPEIDDCLMDSSLLIASIRFLIETLQVSKDDLRLGVAQHLSNRSGETSAPVMRLLETTKYACVVIL
jgi:hypothetical protein